MPVNQVLLAGNVFSRFPMNLFNTAVHFVPALTLGNYLEGIWESVTKGFVIGLQPSLMWRRTCFRPRIFHFDEDWFIGVGFGVGF